jgi:RNA polymerase sigma factor (sigma-70 family)
LEASVLSQPAALNTIGVRAPLRRLCSDERLIDLIRVGDQAAFEALVQRYRSRLLAFCRHMLRSREDAEDVLQEVFAASYRAIVADAREINVRPWLYRIARNMCLKHIARRRPATDGCVEELDIASMSSTAEEVGVREELRQVVSDVRELPETQRTALLLREIDGLSYDQIAVAMDTTVPGVKSLLVRARVSLAETAESRVLTCEVVHLELRDAAAGRARLSGPARKHAKSCEVCGEYQSDLGVGRRAAACWPLGPVALARDLLAKLGLGAGAGASAAGAGAGAVAGGGAAGTVCGACGTAVTTTLGAIGGKAAAAVATAGLAAAGATAIHHNTAVSHPATATPAAIVQQQQVTSPQPQTILPPPKSKGEKPELAAEQPAGTDPSTPADNTTTFPDTPAPTDPKTTTNGGSSAPTDPAGQPMGGTEPVQVQGIPQPSGTQQSTGTEPSTGTQQGANAPTGTTGP